MKMCGRNFLLSDFGDVLANLATTNKAIDKWRLRLDSAGQKGPEITLEGILMVVEGCFTAERSGSGSGFENTLLPMAPVYWSLWLATSPVILVDLDKGKVIPTFFYWYLAQPFNERPNA
jgi:hypothetical protein